NGRDRSARDPRQAIELAKKGIVLREHAGWWQVLCQAYYRAGAYQESIDALGKCLELNPAGADAHEWLFLAMAHWQLGHQQDARRWYDRSVAWIDKHTKEQLDQVNDGLVEDVRTTREEAAQLLGVK